MDMEHIQVTFCYISNIHLSELCRAYIRLG